MLQRCRKNMFLKIFKKVPKPSRTLHVMKRFQSALHFIVVYKNEWGSVVAWKLCKDSQNVAWAWYFIAWEQYIVWGNPLELVINLGNSYFLVSSERMGNLSQKIVGYPSRKGVDLIFLIHPFSGGIPNDFQAKIIYIFRWEQKITVT